MPHQGKWALQHDVFQVPTKKNRRTCQFPRKIPGTSEVHPEKGITPRIVGMGLEKKLNGGVWILQALENIESSETHIVLSKAVGEGSFT